MYAGCLNSRGEGAAELRKKCSDRLVTLALDVTQQDQVTAGSQLVTSSLGDRSKLDVSHRSLSLVYALFFFQSCGLLSTTQE